MNPFKKIRKNRTDDNSQPEKCNEVNLQKVKQEYESLFFKEAQVKTRSGKVVYIRKEYHERILKILRIIGQNEVSLFSYLDNVLKHHFEQFQDDMAKSYNQKNEDDFFNK